MKLSIAFSASVLIASLALDAHASGLNKPTKYADSMTWASAIMKLGGSAPMPAGYYDMCAQHPALCRIRAARGMDTTDDGAVRLTDRLFSQLQTVNDSVNKRIRPTLDVGRDWRIGRSAGNCKDFAINKQHELLQMGWPSSAVLLAHARTSQGEEHLVLVARTDQGDWVLDNLSTSVRRWSVNMYQWQMVQSPDNTGSWRSVH